MIDIKPLTLSPLPVYTAGRI